MSRNNRKNYQALPADGPLGALEPVAYFNGAMPTGVTVSQQGRIFVNFPKWGDDVPFTVGEIRGGIQETKWEGLMDRGPQDRKSISE
jgi:hypothetical protein